jgi:glutamate/tyrosine decarboxylase-like PLP-dependent enzyme
MNYDDQTDIEPFFLGPKSENEYWVRERIHSVLDHWFQWRKSLFVEDAEAISLKHKKSARFKMQQDKMLMHLNELNTLLESETPTYSPRYIGHMVSEISLPAILGHFSTLLHNPNNTAAEISRAGAVLEKEAINMLLELVGFGVNDSSNGGGRGHFTSGGTIANFEAIWRARFRMDHWLSVALYLKEQGLRDIDIFRDCHMGWESFHDLVAKYKVDMISPRAYSMAAGNPWRVAAVIDHNFSSSPASVSGKTKVDGQNAATNPADDAHSARKKHFEGPVLLIPGNKHFSWQKGCNIFGFGEEALWSIPLDDHGHVNAEALRELIETAYRNCRPILMVVSVAGTTETGEIDPIDKIQDVLDQFKRENGWDIWHHVDAAYGGFMCTLNHHPKVANDVAKKEQLLALAAISRANSVTMDPHKLGYVPYSCGAFLASDEQNYSVSQFKAPYLQRADFSHSMWSSTIEGSRSASGAAATWLTGKTIGFASEDFAHIIANTFLACRDFKKDLKASCPWVRALDPSDTNILCFSVANNGDSLSVANQKTLKLFEKIVASPNFAVSKTVLHVSEYRALITKHVKSYAGSLDDEKLFLIRCVFMNPFLNEPDIGAKLRAEFVNEIIGFYNNKIYLMPFG